MEYFKMEKFFYGKKVLVTGATGFVGTNLIKRLVELGAEVRGTIHNKPPQLKIPTVQYVKSNLVDSDSCMEVCEGIDYVFMAAANSSGAEVMERTPLVHLTPNVIMNARILEAAYSQMVKKFCFISSNTVYPVVDHAVKEDDVSYELFDKYHIVGWMKLFSEQMCHMYSNNIANPLATLVVRPGNLYGPFDKYNWKESKVIAALIRRAVEGQDPFVVWGDGSDVKDFLFIEDFISGLLSVFASDSKQSVFNLASGIPITIQDVLGHILSICGVDQSVVKFDASKPTMIKRRLIDVDLINREVGWLPETPIDVGLEQTINWYRNTYANTSPEDAR